MSRRLAIGLACIAFGALIGYSISGGTGALVAACIVLVILPPSYDPAIIMKEWNLDQGGVLPECFGDTYSERFPHTAAERDCESCPHIVHCYSEGRSKRHGPA